MAVVDFRTYRVRYGDGLDRPEGAAHVQVAQCLLNRWLALAGADEIVADGRYGDGTYQTILAFQRAHRLDDDGTIGPATWGELERYANQVSDPAPRPQPILPKQVRLMVIDATRGKYADEVELFAEAANILMPLWCVYTRCNFTIEAGDFDTFDPDVHKAVLLGDGDGGVAGAAGWHWHALVQWVIAELGVPIEDDDFDAIGWVDMTNPIGSFRVFTHEITEIVDDPGANLMARRYGGTGQGANQYYMLENADPDQNAGFRILVDGQVLTASNVLSLNWFSNDAGEYGDYGRLSDLIPAENVLDDFELGAYDAMGRLSGPWEMGNGYQILISPTDPGAISYLFADGTATAEAPLPHMLRRRKAE